MMKDMTNSKFSSSNKKRNFLYLFSNQAYEEQNTVIAYLSDP